MTGSVSCALPFGSVSDFRGEKGGGQDNVGRGEREKWEGEREGRERGGKEAAGVGRP